MMHCGDEDAACLLADETEPGPLATETLASDGDDVPIEQLLSRLWVGTLKKVSFITMSKSKAMYASVVNSCSAVVVKV